MNTLATAAPEARDFDQRLVVAALYHLVQAGRLQTSLPWVSITMTGRSSKPEPDDDDAGARWGRRSRRVMADPAHPLPGGDFTQPETSKHLKRLLAERQQHNNTLEQLGRVGPIQQSEQAWRRVIVEKPFGHDLASADPLNTPILRVLSENQPYRIDHFLGKETVQNILVLRLPAASSSRSGTAIMSTMCRSRRPTLWVSGSAAASAGEQAPLP
jgi:Glucose-6-phosphate dehydrogenase, NAD binding domain